MSRERYPIAWMYHQRTNRWPHNTVELEDEGWAGPPFKEYPRTALFALPEACPVTLPLENAIQGRLSCRSFAKEPLTGGELAALLQNGYGVGPRVDLGGKEHLERPVPSGGGLYPLELYLMVRSVEGIEAGLYHYAPLVRGLETLRAIDLSDSFISQIFMGQPYLAGCGAILVITAVLERTMHKYIDRGYRYILLEAGHVAQNVCLTAAALKLGALPLGGFFDEYVADVFQIDRDTELVLYGLALGRPATNDRVTMRNPDLSP